MTRTRDRWTASDLLAAFNEHLRRTRGVCVGTRRNYARFAGAFLQTVFPEGPVAVAEIRVRDVVDFVGGSVTPLPAEDGGAGGFGAAVVVPVPACGGAAWRPVGGRGPNGAASPGRPCSPSGTGALGAADCLAGLVFVSGLRDRAIILCMSRLGLRASEVVALRLEDVDWRETLSFGCTPAKLVTARCCR
jgi:integrase/recombinase XerD